MKKFTRLTFTMIVMALLFTSCHKTEESNVSEYVKKRVRYEVTCDDPDKEVFIAYAGREHPNGGNDFGDVKAMSCDTQLPWSYEFNSQDNIFMALFEVDSNPHTTKVIGRLYIDGELIEEQSDEGSNILIYKEFDFN